jgi:hypothetical protein
MRFEVDMPFLIWFPRAKKQTRHQKYNPAITAGVRSIIMKQKFHIQKNDSEHVLIIRESAELDKDAMSLLCEVTFQADAIKNAIASGREALIAALRTRNMYPPRTYAEMIADAVQNLYQSKDSDTTELVFNDLDLLDQEQASTTVIDDVEDDASEIDELLDDDFDDDYEETAEIKKINSPIKIQEDSATDLDEEL